MFFLFIHWWECWDILKLALTSRLSVKRKCFTLLWHCTIWHCVGLRLIFLLCYFIVKLLFFVISICMPFPCFSVLHFPSLRFVPLFFSLAFSTLAFVMVPGFPVSHFQHPRHGKHCHLLLLLLLHFVFKEDFSLIACNWLLKFDGFVLYRIYFLWVNP